MRNIIASTLTIVALSIAIGCSSAKDEKPVTPTPSSDGPTPNPDPTPDPTPADDGLPSVSIFKRKTYQVDATEPVSISLRKTGSSLEDELRPLIGGGEYYADILKGDLVAKFNWGREGAPFGKGLISHGGGWLKRNFPEVAQIGDDWTWEMASSWTLMARSASRRRAVFINAGPAMVMEYLNGYNTHTWEAEDFSVREFDLNGDEDFIGISEEPSSKATDSGFNAKYYWGKLEDGLYKIYYTDNESGSGNYQTFVTEYEINEAGQLPRPSCDGNIYWFTNDGVHNTITSLIMKSGSVVNTLIFNVPKDKGNPILLNCPAFKTQDGHYVACQNDVVLFQDPIEAYKQTWSKSDVPIHVEKSIYYSGYPGLTITQVKDGKAEVLQEATLFTAKRSLEWSEYFYKVIHNGVEPELGSEAQFEASDGVELYYNPAKDATNFLRIDSRGNGASYIRYVNSDVSLKHSRNNLRFRIKMYGVCSK